MSANLKPCTLAAKHKWEFVRNITITTATISPRGRKIKYSFRGEYKCACGAERVGQSQHVIAEVA